MQNRAMIRANRLGNGRHRTGIKTHHNRNLTHYRRDGKKGNKIKSALAGKDLDHIKYRQRRRGQ